MESSFSSIQNLIAARLRSPSEIIHSQLSSESNYLHLLRSLQPPAKEPPEDTVARLEGSQRAAGTVLVWAVLEGAQVRERRQAWNQVKRVGLFQGDNFAEYYSSFGSVGKLKDVEVLRNCERAIFRCVSRRIVTAFTRWKEWTYWLHFSLLQEIPRLVLSLYRSRAASGFNAIRSWARAKRYQRKRTIQKISRIGLIWMRYGSEGLRQALATWRNTQRRKMMKRTASIQSQLLRYKVRPRQTIERKVLLSALNTCRIQRERIALRGFNRWKYSKVRLRVQLLDQHTDPLESQAEEAERIQQVKERLLALSLEVLQSANYI